MLSICVENYELNNLLDGWKDGWMDGWKDGRESRVKDCLQQSKIKDPSLRDGNL